MIEDLDPVAVLCELAEQDIRRLGTRFQVAVQGDCRDFAIPLTIPVDEYEEEREPATPCQETDYVMLGDGYGEEGSKEKEKEFREKNKYWK